MQSRIGTGKCIPSSLLYKWRLLMEQEKICVEINGEKREYPWGITFGEIAQDYEGSTRYPIVLVTVSLSLPVPLSEVWMPFLWLPL